MAGIHDIGIKVYGSRNTRNTGGCYLGAGGWGVMVDECRVVWSCLVFVGFGFSPASCHAPAFSTSPRLLLAPAQTPRPPPPPFAVKCLFDAFDRMRTTEELVQQPGKVIMTVPPGRYSKPLRVKAWARARA